MRQPMENSKTGVLLKIPNTYKKWNKAKDGPSVRWGSGEKRSAGKYSKRMLRRDHFKLIDGLKRVEGNSP